MFPMQKNKGGSLTTQPEHPLDTLRREFDRLWSGWLTPINPDFGTQRMWDFGMDENDKEIIVRAEMPGFDEKELDVQLHNDVLTIKAEKEQKGNGQQQSRSFSRTVTLPPGVDADKAQATYRNGVLELHFPRPEGTQPKRIQIQGQEGKTLQKEAMPSKEAK